MKTLFLHLFISFLCCIPILPQAAASDDYQFWSETQLIFPLVKRKDASGKTTEKLSLFVNGNLRFGRNISRLADKRIGFGFDYKLNKYVSFTPGYLYIAQLSAANRKQYESRLRFAVNIENSWKKFSVGDRNLVEYRFRNNSADSVRYRNRFRILYPVKKDKKELFVPFAANEIFYDFQAKTVSRNEFTAGLSRKLNSNATADFFYLLQTNKSGSPQRLNVFGVNLKIKID
ncbi:MAG TPA: DUF2490 domain-containing protein [Pyrinomonadaceae bacterium]|nr:DUF2490 domain-containing protein [Pyrinomonadaceae bacterium]